MLIVDDAAVLYYFFTLIVRHFSQLAYWMPNMNIRKTIRKINDVAKNTKIAHCAIIAHM